MKLLNPGYDNNMDSLYNNCQYDNSTSSTICDLVSESSLVNNSLYWNKGTGNCYHHDLGNTYVTCDFSDTGLTDTAKGMIDKHTWNLGSNDGTIYTYNNIKTKTSYELERSNNTGKICTSGNHCNDTVNRTTTWEGYVGLMYPSDYGYAVGGEARNNCLSNTTLDAYNIDCITNDWLFNSSGQWTISPSTYTSTNNYVRYVTSNGRVYGTIASYGKVGVRPTIFLIPSIEISGDGTPTNPYTLNVE